MVGMQVSTCLISLPLMAGEGGARESRGSGAGAKGGGGEASCGGGQERSAGRGGAQAEEPGGRRGALKVLPGCDSWCRVQKARRKERVGEEGASLPRGHARGVGEGVLCDGQP